VERRNYRRTVNDEQQAYVDSTGTIYMVNGKAEGAANGALMLQAVYKPGHTSKEQKIRFCIGQDKHAR
jgi:hypothetical protein